MGFKAMKKLMNKIDQNSLKLESFKVFNNMGAKFRVAIINKCNMNCFFCHNEGMKNPRLPGDKTPILRSEKPLIPTEKMIKLMNDFCELGGKQLNITGGEPYLFI
jgi:molybdenum cofactor biosynthesis enzyme MoaA